MKIEIPFSDYLRNSTKDVPGHCVYTFTIYPTKEFQDEYHSRLPLIMFLVVAAAFCLMILTFLAYDWFVQRHNKMVVGAAARANGILSTLFPKNIRDRLLDERELEEENKIADKKKSLPDIGNKARLTSFLNHEADGMNSDEDAVEDNFMYKSKPIADLFPETTIMFADISGFTAWSSTREPSQVFILLETIYKAFDEIARRRRVFKVETIGDCYVAVAGLPDPRKDHAVAMARFSRDCMHRMNQLTKKLEVVLGPDTTDLAMRFGLHSGPVTAGVLRGEKSRFQLFGDTMNTASRMESTGLRDRIQVSQDTADLLIAAGKPKWVEARDEKVVAKGKGEIQTYWVAVGASNHSSSEGDTSTVGSEDEQGKQSLDPQEIEEIVPAACAKTARLVKWNVDLLANLLKQVQAGRDATNVAPLEPESDVTLLSKQTVLEEVEEIIHLPTFRRQKKKVKKEKNDALSAVVLEQLEDYVSTVASMYRDNPFHNFEHASHVVMSAVKLLSRIVAPDIGEEMGKDMASTLHDHTYGITSDPLTQFACVFSALIHDADHTGVPNTQLNMENSTLAKVYKNKSVAEQNSVDLCWDLLMDSNFDELRAAIYSTDDERKRFRQLVVNSVMATDIMDKELKLLRNNRWAKAFSDDACGREVSNVDAADRKATIVIEHLIQASDISHTMQHWHIYRKWNARLFEELYRALVQG
jgi:class 3 adenylate cyclase